ncbi:MAG: hypothetical protein JXQ73_14695 [Phycisphaerae bacterium]|nr:hypothetical protein [Phycisphaerae bacterium]
MNWERDETLLSQLVDGELDSDEANVVLLSILDDERGRGLLKGLLEMRQRLAPIRQQCPNRTIVIASAPADSPMLRHVPRRVVSLGAAAVIGGLLVLVGFWAAGERGRPHQVTTEDRVSPGRGVSAEQMRELAKAFELHESVAGRLGWYAADDQHIRVSPARREAETGRPVGVALRLIRAEEPTGESKAYFIVCRVNSPAEIDLPGAQVASRVRVSLVPRTTNGDVRIRYAIAASPPGGNSNSEAALIGERTIGSMRTTLGQLALGDRLVTVEASAWVLGETRL